MYIYLEIIRKIFPKFIFSYFILVFGFCPIIPKIPILEIQNEPVKTEPILEIKIDASELI
ncbi:hypothetical protein [Nitrosopumilus adriaticus]|uniref:hypothetical protein n=1 Tax=Nitrosopumilus adriaticus TaxID=1580092 RepID=UPI00352CB3A4